jgi:hypothetical protein
MARMTLGQAHDKALEVQRSVARLQQLAADVDRLNGSPKDARTRQRKAGRDHELDMMAKLTADLVVGLAGIGPARNGQLGGQRQGGMDTAAAAVELVAPKADTQRGKVLTCLRDWYGSGGVYGLTDVQLAKRTGLAPNSVRPRRVELVDAGWLEDSGRRREHNGRPHVVWQLTEAAHEALPKLEETNR